MKKRIRELYKGVDPGRRQMLGMLTAAAAVSTLDPVQMLINGLVDGLINKAQAVGKKDPRNYLYVSFPYGPSRYHWDLPLCPYYALDGSSYTYPTAYMNPALVNKFSGTSGTATEYGTLIVTAPNSKVKLRMPYLWGLNIPTSDGSSVPMVNLLDNMIFIRGIQSLDGHGDSRLIQIRPKPGAPSIDGAVTDVSNRAVPSIALRDSPGIYNSARGIGNIRIEAIDVGSNPLAKILAPFDRSQDGVNSGFLSRRQAMNAAIGKAMDALGAAAHARNPGAEILWSSRSTAEALIAKGVGDVSSVYSTLFNKYTNLINRCATEHLSKQVPFIMDRTMSFSSLGASGSFGINGAGPFVANMHEAFVSTTSLAGLAESFAIAEYLFVNGYSSAITAACAGVSGLQVSGYATYSWDEHATGTIANVVVNGFAWRGVAACLYEFVQAMKTAKIFEETVIHMGGEFSRSPRIDQTGYDHSPDGSAISIISGAIKQPYVIGDTRPSVGDNDHMGNYGIGNVMLLDGGMRQPSAGNQASTLAHLLRVSSPSPNDASMLVETSSGIVPAVDLAKNKGES